MKLNLEHTMSEKWTQNQLKKLYDKGYRYLLTPQSGNFLALGAKCTMDIGPVMRDYPDEVFDVTHMQPDGTHLWGDGSVPPF
jgi:hypothetical protein